MKIHKFLAILVLLSVMSGVALADKKHHTKKVNSELSVMVLGSGGPVATQKGRASAGYLIFTDGEPRILMDVGGGTFQRLARSGVNIKDIDIVLLSHLHIDHTADLSAMLKTIYFHNNMARNKQPDLPGRVAPINIYGPTSTSFPDARGGKFPGSNILQYPSTQDYVDQHYSVSQGGVERYLHAFAPAISGGVSKFAYTANDLSSNWMVGNIETVLEQGDLKISAIAVNHGPVPAVAYRIDYKGYSIVYSGDTSSKTDNMIELSQNADLLIYDTAITQDLPLNPVFHALHTAPKRIGEVAAEAGVSQLLLSHVTPVTETRMGEVTKAIRAAQFHGKIKIARDLKVYNLDD